MDDIQVITSVIQDIGVWALFAWLYLKERSHNRELNEQYRTDLRNITILRGGVPIGSLPHYPTEQHSTD